MKDIFGIYNMRSRISVGIIFLAPLLIHAYILIPEIRSITSTLIISLIIYALSGIIIIFSRMFGSKALLKCFPEGLPAQQFLMPNNSCLDKYSKERYYNFFKHKIPTFQISKNEDEMRAQVDTSITWLISQTRDNSKFPLIAEENMNLGFAYNLLGLKPLGICLNLLLLFINVITIFIHYKYHFYVNIANIVYCLIATIFSLLLWLFIITKSLVVNCGKKYARALLSACDSPELN